MALLPKSQRDQSLVFVVILAIGLAGVYWQYVYSPRSTELAERRAHIESLEASNARARRELSRGSVKALKDEAAAYARNLELMRQLVPTGNEVPLLLEQVSTAARRAGLDLSAVQPQPVVEGEEFDTYRYRIAVVGSYHALAEFLANVGSLTRIMAPVNVALAPVASAPGTPGRAEAKIDCRFDIQTYVARTAARSAAAPGRKS